MTAQRFEIIKQEDSLELVIDHPNHRKTANSESMERQPLNTPISHSQTQIEIEESLGADKDQLIQHLKTTPSKFNPLNSKFILAAIALISLTSIFLFRNFSYSDDVAPSYLQGSNFKTTAAIVRFGSVYLPERRPLIDRYSKYFGHLAISAGGDKKVNDTIDFQTCGNWYMCYQCLPQLLELIAEDKQEITGMLYFHFDFWIVPNEFNAMNFTQQWIVSDGLIGNDNAIIKSMCNNYRESNPRHEYMLKNWVWYNENTFNGLDASFRIISETLPEFKTFKNRGPVLCNSWLDMFYLPRHLWIPFSKLALIMGQFKIAPEIAVPTILDILKYEYPEIGVSILNDCLGGCCDVFHDPKVIQSSRCGHKIPLDDETAAVAHFSRI